MEDMILVIIIYDYSRFGIPVITPVMTGVLRQTPEKINIAGRPASVMLYRGSYYDTATRVTTRNLLITASKYTGGNVF